MRSFSTLKINVFIVIIGLAILFLHSDKVFAQFVPVSLQQRIENSTLILEGKVISQASYWDETKANIYTSNVVEVYKLFKGQLASTKVEMITMGGVVGDRIERVTNMLTLNIGDTGVFTAIPNTKALTTGANLPKFKTYAGIQGFIKYNLTDGSAADLFNQYKHVGADLYQKIMSQTKINVKIVQKAPFKI
ncbi:hypothetical protein WG904_04090 [Pedobacter sp. Du54]|uniref:hypothetical protein n=1 Tax=Pedobacter anseongensis TaxID=3133439 RepID=UPI0030ADF7C3